MRPKKTIKQRKEDFCKNLIIIISNQSKDKKILELQKICYNFNFISPNNIQISNIINYYFNNIDIDYIMKIQKVNQILVLIYIVKYPIIMMKIL